MLRPAIALLLAALPSLAHAQSKPNWSYGYVPSAGEYGAAFAKKQDLLQYTPLNQAGGTMQGKLQAAPSTTNRAGFSLLPGIAPASPSEGDFWVTGGNLYGRLNGQTTGFAPLSSPTFSGTTTASKLAITGSGSTGDVSGMNVTPNAGAPAGTLGLMSYAPSFAGGVVSSGTTALDTTYASTINPNAVMLRPGNSVAFCPALACIFGPPDGSVNSAYFGKQRATLLISGATRVDGEAEEQALAVTTTIGTGFVKAYAPSTSYAIGDNVTVGNATYRATVAGTTGASSAPPGTRPTSLPFTAVDGTVTWSWINDGVLSAKAAVYKDIRVAPGGGNVHGDTTNVQLDPGVIPRFISAGEINFRNNSGTDCAAGTQNCLGLYLTMDGTNQSTTGINVSSAKTSGYGALWGIQLSGNNLAQNADIDIESGAKVGLGFNTSGIGAGAHSVAAIQDASTGPRSLYITGAHTTASIDDPSTSPTTLSITGTKSVAEIILGASSPKAIRIQGTKTSASIEDVSTSPATVVSSGTKSLAGIYEASTSPNGISLAGTYSGSQINGTGWNVDPTGKLTTPGAKLTGYTVANLPACNASSKGTMTMATDVSAAPTYRQTGLAGGGSVAVPVFCNGSAYEAH